MTEDEMVGWHHRLKGQEFEQALGVGDGQRSLMCCSPWGHKEPDMTQQLNNNNNNLGYYSANQKEQSNKTGYIMDGLQKHCANQQKPGIRDHMLQTLFV